MALAMLTLAARPADEEHAYGQSKAEERPRALAALLTGKLRQLISIRKIVRPEIGSIYHITMRGQAKRLVLLANEFVVNFFTTFEKGVKTGWRVLNQQCRPLTIV